MKVLNRYLGPDALRLRNVSVLSVDHVFRSAVGFVVAVLVARHLGPDRYGTFAYVFGIVGLFAPLTVFGLQHFTIRRLVSTPEEHAATLGTALLIRSAGSIAAFILVIFVPLIVDGPRDATIELLALAGLMLIALPSETLNDVFRARERMGWIAAPKSAVAAIIAIATVLLVWRDASLIGFVAVRVGEAVLLALATWIALSQFLRGAPRLAFDRDLAGTMLRTGTPLFLSAISVIIYMRIDQVMLGAMTDASVLGNYAVATKFAEIVYFIPIAIAASYYAGMVRSHDTSKDMFRSEMQALFDVVGLVTIALALAVAITAWFILIPTFGADYAEAVPMVAVLAPSVVFVGLGVARSNVLTIEGWNWTSFVTTSAGAVLNVGLNLVLIPHYGGIGAALATVAAYAFAVIGGSYLLPWMWPVAGALVRSLNPIGAARRVARLAATQGETAV